MKPIIDVHSHIIPKVDDGCETMDEAREMIDLYTGQNVEAVICTPHYGVYGIQNSAALDHFESLWITASCRKIGLYLGNEILFDRFTLMAVRRGLARTMNLTPFVRIEFDPFGGGANADYILNCVSWFAQSEYTPILAHAERYPALQNKPSMYRKLVRAGAKLQINAYDIYNTPNELTKQTTRDLLKQHLVSFIGSDTHGKRRPPLLLDGVSWIYDNITENYADAVVHDNAAKLLLQSTK